MKLMEQLFTETKSRHEQIGALPYFAALEKKELPIESYIGFLRLMAEVHASLEREIVKAVHPSIAKVWDCSMERVESLKKDLAYLEAMAGKEIPQARSLDPAVKMESRRIECPVSLLGCLYVLEGSTLGARAIKPKLASNFKLSDGPGLLYYSGYGSRAVESWKEFTRRMDEAGLDLDERKEVVAAAIELLEDLTASIGSLYPLK